MQHSKSKTPLGSHRHSNHRLVDATLQGARPFTSERGGTHLPDCEGSATRIESFNVLRPMAWLALGPENVIDTRVPAA